jgi:type I restriction enzyme S subunit
VSFDLAVEAALRSAPPSWRVEQFRRLASLVSEPRGQRPLELLSLSSDGVVAPRQEEGGLGRQAPAEETMERYWATRPGDLVVNPMWLVGGGIGVADVHGAVSPDYRVYRLRSELYPRYMHYLLRSQPYRDQYRLYTRADTTFDRRVSKENFHPLPVLVPPLDQQRCVADFLNAETARMDALAAARIRQVDLLAEYVRAGLSSTADALIARWGSSKLRYVLLAIEQGWSPECEDRPTAEEEWGVVKAGCVNGGVFQPDQHKTLPSDVAPRREYQLRPGDLLMSRASGSIDLIGSVGVVPALNRRLLLCDKVYRLRVDATKVKVAFVAHMLRTQAVREQIKLGISGATGLANNLPSSVVKVLVIPMPPLDVQEQTVTSIQQVLEKVGNVQDSLNTQLALLAERRQALITAAVTGQIDVTTARGVRA